MKKKLGFALSILCMGSLLFTSCANEIMNKSESSFASENTNRTLVADDKCTTPVNIHVLYANSENLVAWSWAVTTGGNENYKCDVWNDKSTKGLTFVKDLSNENMFNLTFSVDPERDLGILFVNDSGQTGDIVIDKSELVANTHFYFIYGDTKVYNSAAECVGLKSGEITDKDGKTVVLNVFGKADSTKDTFTVKDSEGTTLDVENVEASATKATITLSTGAIAKRPYSVTLGSETILANISSVLIDELGLKYEEDDLGVKVTGSSATFKVWAPTASSVEILFYDEASEIGTFKASTVAAKAIGGTDEEELEGTPSATESMSSDSKTGVWSYELSSIGSKKYYKYKINVNGQTLYVCDINAKVCAPDSVAAQIADINSSDATPDSWESSYTNPFGSNQSEIKTYNDAVIYEMHIRDWSRAVVSDSTGKFLDISDGTAIMNHLKDLGVTHVQILPMFDYAQVNADKKYNWGYNPYHYNVPEGRYVADDYTDGTQAVKEMRQMIKTFHDNGIAVIMDVVYNHTNGTGTGSLYDSTVPGYFYHQDASGSYINYSGCGNGLNLDNAMVRKYVVDSLKHWMNDYHINGFRFDLMGIHSKAAMKEIYESLYEIDKNVLVYGEPWTGNGEYPDDGAKSADKATKGYGFGAFDDDFRDAIKGKEFGGFGKGQIQGSFNDSGIVAGLLAKSGSNRRNETGISGLGIHYAECHDNFTLFDKLVYSTISVTGDSFAPKFKDAYDAVMNSEQSLNKIKAQVKLAGAYLFLAQGTPFINGGQEFLRTKKGDPDSYAADTKGGITWTTKYDDKGTYTEATDIDAVNTINLSMKESYIDVYNTYKGLIALRKSSNAFTAGVDSTAKKLSSGVTEYIAKSGSEEYAIYFNASDKDYYFTDVTIEGTGVGLAFDDSSVSFGKNGKTVTINETTGAFEIASSESVCYMVPAKSFVILKK